MTTQILYQYDQTFLKIVKINLIINFQRKLKFYKKQYHQYKQWILFVTKSPKYCQITLQNNFPITQEDGIGTQQSNSIIVSEYQIWDFPGYGVEEDSTKDIENRIKQITMMNKALAIHIIIVFPYTQFTQDRGQNIIQLINLIAQKDLPASIIISKVPPKQKLQNIVEKLQTQLGQDEVIYSDEAKDFLDQLIFNRRIQLFYYPQLIEENYHIQKIQLQQFKKENSDLIKELVFDKKYFNKVKVESRFLSNQKLIINDYIQQSSNILNQINQQLIKQTILNNITKITRSISDQELHKNESIYKDLSKQKNKYLGYQQIFKQISNLCQHYDLIDTQINKINEFFKNKDFKIIQNQLYIYCVCYSLSELKSIYDSNRSIQGIFILSFYLFIVDCDIEMPGVHIYIKCKQFRFIKKSLINLKGLSGQPFLKQARSGDEKNIHGDVGQDGNKGVAGGIFYLDAQEYFCIEKLSIDISGGDGGNGEDGGDGLNGKDGENGKAEEVEQRLKECELEVQEQVVPEERVVLLHYFYLSQGKPGSIGGDAGCGGKGAQSGASGIAHFLNFKLAKQNIIDNNSKIGLNGKNGRQGSGGQYGLDFIGLYQDFKSIANEVNKEMIKHMHPVTITLSVLNPFYAIGYFTAMGLDTLGQLISAKIDKGWKYKQFNEENKNWATSGSVINEDTISQQQISLDLDYNPRHKLDIEKFQKIQNQKKNEMVQLFKEISLFKQNINFILSGVYI